MLNYQRMEDWQSDRMRWTRNPVYPLPGIGGLNPSSSAKFRNQEPSFYSFIKTTRHEKNHHPHIYAPPADDCTGPNRAD